MKAWRKRTVREMLALGLGPEEAAGETARAEARIAARQAWALARIADLEEAQQRCDDAWMRLLEADPDAEGPPPEQAEVDRIFAEIQAVRDHDRWPRHLHWGDV